jgi:hypothetical protein
MGATSSREQSAAHKELGQVRHGFQFHALQTAVAGIPEWKILRRSTTPQARWWQSVSVVGVAGRPDRSSQPPIKIPTPTQARTELVSVSPVNRNYGDEGWRTSNAPPAFRASHCLLYPSWRYRSAQQNFS